MKKLILVLAGVILVAGLSGCETIRGLGEDIQNTGDNIWEGLNKGK